MIKNGTLPDEFVANYTAAESFDTPNGKFPGNLGNVAVVDCSSLSFRIADNMDLVAKKMDEIDVFLGNQTRLYAQRLR
jgi:hypothetical protein